MPQQRRLARRLAFQTLFELESRPGRPPRHALQDRVDAWTEDTGQHLERGSFDFASRLVEGTLGDREEIDTVIAAAAPTFPVDQIAVTDRAALELAVYEMLREQNVPVKVAINEAVELAKTYGGESSGRFVNGVLGTIAEDVIRKRHDQHSDRAIRK